MHWRVIIDIVLLLALWIIEPIVMVAYARAKDDADIKRRSPIMSLLSAISGLFIVTICLFQDICLTLGYGFPCLLVLATSMSHIPLYSIPVIIKSFDFVMRFSPEMRREGQRKGGSVMLITVISIVGTVIIILVVLFLQPDTYLAPLQSHDGSYFSTIGGRECSIFGDWYIYICITVLNMYLTKDVSRQISRVDDYWHIGREMRRNVVLVSTLTPILHFINACAWFNVFDRPAFESAYVPISYMCCLYYSATFCNFILYPLMSRRLSLNHAVIEYRQSVHTSITGVNSYLSRQTSMSPMVPNRSLQEVVELVPTATEGDELQQPATTNDAASRMLSVDHPLSDLDVPTPPAPSEVAILHRFSDSSSVARPAAYDRDGSSERHFISICASPFLLERFHSHARRALCADITSFFIYIRDTYYTDAKWKAIMDAIRNSKEGAPSIMRRAQSNATIAAAMERVTVERTATMDGHQMRSVAPALSSSTLNFSTIPSTTEPLVTTLTFDCPSESYHLLYLVSRCYRLYIAEGSEFEFDYLSDRLRLNMAKLNSELLQNESIAMQVQKATTYVRAMASSPVVPRTSVNGRLVDNNRWMVTTTATADASRAKQSLPHIVITTNNTVRDDSPTTIHVSSSDVIRPLLSDPLGSTLTPPTPQINCAQPSWPSPTVIPGAVTSIEDELHRMNHHGHTSSATTIELEVVTESTLSLPSSSASSHIASSSPLFNFISSQPLPSSPSSTSRPLPLPVCDPPTHRRMQLPVYATGSVDNLTMRYLSLIVDIEDEVMQIMFNRLYHTFEQQEEQV